MSPEPGRLVPLLGHACKRTRRSTASLLDGPSHVRLLARSTRGFAAGVADGGGVSGVSKIRRELGSASSGGGRLLASRLWGLISSDLVTTCLIVFLPGSKRVIEQQQLVRPPSSALGDSTTQSLGRRGLIALRRLLPRTVQKTYKSIHGRRLLDSPSQWSATSPFEGRRRKGHGRAEVSSFLIACPISSRSRSRSLFDCRMAPQLPRVVIPRRGKTLVFV